MSDNTFVVLCHEEDRAVWHEAEMVERRESEAEKRLYTKPSYGIHTMPEEFWSTGPCPVDASRAKGVSDPS